MQALTTPEERFENLPGYAWQAHYADVEADGATVRMAFLNEGAPEARPVLLLHGEPSWSYLYRHMIGPLLDAGLRVLVPDLIGFGRSEKPGAREDYTYARHVEWLEDLVVRHLDLNDTVLFCQDWGGLLGLRVVAAHPERFAARGRLEHDAADAAITTQAMRSARGATSRRPRRASRSAGSSTARPSASCRPRRSPPTTRRSRTSASRPARASSPRSCRSRPTIPPRRRTGRRGRC